MKTLKNPATLITKTIATEVTDICAVTNDFKVDTFNHFSFNAYANLNLRHEGNKLSFVSCNLTFEEDDCGNHPGTVMNKGSEQYQRFLNYARETAYNLADAEMLKLIKLGL